MSTAVISASNAGRESPRITGEVYERESARPIKAGMVVWRDSVTDVVGESVKGAIADVLGKEPAAVRFGRAYYVPRGSGAALKRAVTRTLVNEVVNKFKIGNC